MTDTYLTRYTLVRRLQFKHDESSWDDFVSYYGRFIFSVINTLKVNPSDADDIYQQVLLKIWNSIDKFKAAQQKGSFRNWIYTITKNTALKLINKNSFKESCGDQIKEGLYSQEVNPEIDELIQEEWNRHISTLAFEKIGEKVSEKAMDVFKSQFEGESTEDTATRLGIEVSTVYIYRNRIKDALVAEIRNLRELLE